MDMLKLGEYYYFIVTSKTQCQLLQRWLLQQKCLLVAGAGEKIFSHIRSDSLRCPKKKKTPKQKKNKEHPQNIFGVSKYS
jgi:hypothetical protein